MPSKKNKNDYIILGVLGAVTAAVLFIFVVWDIVKEEPIDTPGIRTTRSANVDSAIICYTLYERLGISVERSEKILFADILNNIDVMFLLDPLTPVQSGEIDDIKSWLINGGILISTDIPKGLHPDLDFLHKNKSGDIYTNRIVRPLEESAANKASSSNVELKDLPLARDVSTVSFGTHEILDANTLNRKRPDNPLESLFSDSVGLRIAGYKLGKGCFIILSDSSFLANGQIGKEDNSVLAVNLVSYALSRAMGGKVMFDEYHLGFGYRETGFNVLSRLLFTTPAGWTVLSLTAAGVLYILYKGRRFGPRRGLAMERRRSKLEYINSVGATYRAAGAAHLTLKLIINWLRHEMINMTGVAPNASNMVIAEELSRRKGDDYHKYKDVLDETDKLLGQKKLTERQLLSITKQLAQIETEVFNEHRNR